MYVFQLKYQVA